MNNIAVSVIIPFYSNTDWLIEAVKSVFNQTFKNFEIIVIDDGAREDISPFLKKYRDKILYKWKENGGPASARNLGIEFANGKYIAFLDSDDIWYEQKLELQVDLMEKTEAIWSHASYSLFKNDDPKKNIKTVNLEYFKGIVFPKCLISSPIATPCVMIRNQYLKDNPSLRFEETMRYGQDWYLWINIAIREPLFVLPNVLAKIRLRGGNAALRAKVQLNAKAQIWKYISKNSDMFFGRNKVNYIMRSAYQMCFIGNAFVEKVEHNLIRNIIILEWISKIIYIAPYTVFKLLKRFYFKG